MKYVTLFVFCYLFFSCKAEKKQTSSIFTSVVIEPVLQDSLLSIRAIDILDDKSLAFAANNNSYGLMNPITKEWKISKKKLDSLELNFRAVAHTKKDFLMLSVGTPAFMFKTTNNGMKVCYKEIHSKVFYDSMLFWNDLEGIAVGDPTGDCMSIIITRDGGDSWNKLSCDVLPETANGEAAFAASNSNISIVGNDTWIATGGQQSRIFHSPDKGISWNAYETPILKGAETTGIYSIDFYNDSLGFAIGGDYTKPDDMSANKMYTSDGGKTWKLIGVNKEPGYRSCVQYVPYGEGQELVAVGFKGVDYSKDGGRNWTHLSDQSFYTLRFLNNNVAYAAGRGIVAMLTFE